MQYEVDKQTHKLLKRMIAVLYVLAAFARRAGAFPRPFRSFALFMLRPREARMRAFVTRVADDFDVLPVLPDPASMLITNDPAAVMRLAHCFQALAELLEDLLWLDCQNVAAANRARFTSPSRGEVAAKRRVGVTRVGTIAYLSRVGVISYLSRAPPPRTPAPTPTRRWFT